MTSGSNQGLFVMVSVIIFGIFIVISYVLFQDKLSTGLATIFSDSFSNVKLTDFESEEDLSSVIVDSEEHKE